MGKQNYCGNDERQNIWTYTLHLKLQSAKLQRNKTNNKEYKLKKLKLVFPTIQSDAKVTWHCHCCQTSSVKWLL